MLRNYLTVAWRALRRRAAYTAINVLGLAVGIGACLLISLYVRHELSYDDFHADADRVVRVVEKAGFRPEDVDWNASTTGKLAPQLRTSFADVASATRIWDQRGQALRREHAVVEDVTVYFTGPSFLDVFGGFALQQGTADALERPHTMVLTASLAARVFGSADPLGRSVQMELRDSLRAFEVVGVMADVPSNSHLQFGALASFSTLETTRLSIGANQFWTYARLTEGGASREALADRILAFNRDDLGKEYVKDVRLEALRDVYFSDVFAPHQGSRRIAYLFSAIALGILLIAAFNYMNLATARAVTRAREVGVRKTLGAHRGQLAGQFFGESLLLTLLALPLALGGVALVLPTFNALADTQIAFAPSANAEVAGLLVGVTATAGLLAGSYPALFLSRFQPIEVLRERLPVGRSGAGMRKALIVLQFAVSAALLFGTAVVWQQLQYVQQKELGFDEEQVVTLPLKNSAMRAQAAALAAEMARQPGVVQTARAYGVPTVGGFGRIGFVFPWNEREVGMQRAFVDEVFLETFDIQLLAGRDFRPGDIARAEQLSRGDDPAICILNETAVEALGWTPEEAVGKVIEPFQEKRVVGVVEDFHYRSLRRQIEPLAIEPAPRTDVVAARLAPGDVGATLDRLRATWAEVAPDTPFEYQFLNQHIDQLYRQEQRTARIFSGFAGLAILLACLGLFGLAAYTAERRTQEIGIRKALGASARQVVLLLSKEFVALVAVACVLAAPVAYWGMQRWLADFAYRVELSPLLFAGSALGALLLALAAVSTQALRAAHTDPAQALRSE